MASITKLPTPNYDGITESKSIDDNVISSFISTLQSSITFISNPLKSIDENTLETNINLEKTIQLMETEKQKTIESVFQKSIDENTLESNINLEKSNSYLKSIDENTLETNINLELTNKKLDNLINSDKTEKGVKRESSTKTTNALLSDIKKQDTKAINQNLEESKKEKSSKLEKAKILSSFLGLDTLSPLLNSATNSIVNYFNKDKEKSTKKEKLKTTSKFLGLDTLSPLMNSAIGKTYGMFESKKTKDITNEKLEKINSSILSLKPKKDVEGEFESKFKRNVKSTKEIEKGDKSESKSSGDGLFGGVIAAAGALSGIFGGLTSGIGSIIGLLGTLGSTIAKFMFNLDSPISTPQKQTTVPQKQDNAKPVSQTPQPDNTKKDDGKKSVGKRLAKAGKVGIGGIVGGIVLDQAAEKAEEAGMNNVSAGLDTANYALSGASLGAMVGSVVPVVGTAAGAIAGGAIGGAFGLYQNYSRFGDSEKEKDQKPVTDKIKSENAVPVPSTPSTPVVMDNNLTKPSLATPGSGTSPGIKPDKAGPPGLKMPVITGDDKSIMAMIEKHEGKRYKPYKDSLGLWTVGVGHLIGDGKTLPPEWNRTFSEEEVQTLFANDYKHHKEAAMKFPGWSNLDKEGQAALIDLTFNMGPTWYKKWPSFTKAAIEGNPEGAAKSLEDSKWYTQVGNRAKTIVSLIKSGFKSSTENISKMFSPTSVSTTPKSSFVESAPTKTSPQSVGEFVSPKTLQQPSTVTNDFGSVVKTDSGSTLTFGEPSSVKPSIMHVPQIPSRISYEVPKQQIQMTTAVEQTKKKVEMQTIPDSNSVPSTSVIAPASSTTSNISNITNVFNAPKLDATIRMLSNMVQLSGRIQ